MGKSRNRRRLDSITIFTSVVKLYSIVIFSSQLMIHTVLRNGGVFSKYVTLTQVLKNQHGLYSLYSMASVHIHNQSRVARRWCRAR